MVDGDRPAESAGKENGERGKSGNTWLGPTEADVKSISVLPFSSFDSSSGIVDLLSFLFLHFERPQPRRELIV